MTTELQLLAWVLVLAVVQILLPAHFRTRETGLAFNTGPRDEPGPPVGRITGRLKRAEQNLFETLPLFAAALIIAHIAQREGSFTLWGAWLYTVGRIVYVPLYALGVPYARSVIWAVSLIGLLLVLAALLVPR
jgi:uncharacterized MAPEG superfamily protein